MCRWGLAALLIAATTGCPGFGDQTLAELEGIESATWETDIFPLMEKHCFDCHGETPRKGAIRSFYNYEQAGAQADRIVVSAVQLRTMPPGTSRGLTDLQRATLDAWLLTGAPEK